MTFDAVIFDWRGTLVTTLSEQQWVSAALGLASFEATDSRAQEVLAAINAAGGETRLDRPGVDSDRVVHRRTYYDVFRDAALSPQLADALYAVESDPEFNVFADDVGQVLRVLRERRMRIAVLSDIHFDIRPAFARNGLTGLVDVFTLSFERGMQKPDPRLFAWTLRELGTGAGRTLMVGDRSGPDGGAVEYGIATLLVPPLRSPAEQRLHHVVRLCTPV